MPEAKAFVISPIGAPQSDLRRHADWVLDQIIRKACERVPEAADIVVERSDEFASPGEITDQMISSIVNDRIIFVVLAGDRPNVYYELAIALAAGRPAILLKHDEEETHFDVKDLRVISYAYDRSVVAHPPAPEAKINEVARFVRRVLAQPPYTSTVFGSFDALGRSYREYEFKETFKKITLEEYCEIFLEARESIALQGISLAHFAKADPWSASENYRLPTGARFKPAPFFTLLEQKILLDAVSVRVVMMHEDNPALAHHLSYLDPKNFDVALAAARDEIKRSFLAWTNLQQEISIKQQGLIDNPLRDRPDGKKGALEVFQLRHGIVNHRLIMTDLQTVLSPYFNIYPYNSAGPALVVQNVTPLYKCLNLEFAERIRSNAAAIEALAQFDSSQAKPASSTG